MDFGRLEQWLWYFNIAAAVILLVRLYQSRLAGIYSTLILYLGVDTFQQIVELAVLRRPKLYGRVYFGGQAIKVALAVFVVVQLYRLALAQHPALAVFGRRTLIYLFGAGAVVSAAGLPLDPTLRNDPSPILHAFLRFERSVDLFTLVVLLVIAGFLLWFPVRTRRNVALCLAGFVFYSLERWTGLLLINLWPDWVRPISVTMLGFSFVCLAAGIVFLRRSGETHSTVTGHRWNAAEARRLSVQLDAINDRLDRLIRS